VRQEQPLRQWAPELAQTLPVSLQVEFRFEPQQREPQQQELQWPEPQQPAPEIVQVLPAHPRVAPQLGSRQPDWRSRELPQPVRQEQPLLQRAPE